MKQHKVTISLKNADTIFNLVNTLRNNGAIVNIRTTRKNVEITWFVK
jgi:hypothetical protein